MGDSSCKGTDTHRIQVAVWGYLVRRHATAVCAADAEASRLERLLRRQETVNTVRGDELERARFLETFMAVLLRLYTISGYYPAVREARHVVTRRVVGLQEVFDVVLATPKADACRVPASLDQVLEGTWDGAGETPAPSPCREAKVAASELARGDAERLRRREAMVESAEAGSGDGERLRMGHDVIVGRWLAFRSLASASLSPSPPAAAALVSHLAAGHHRLGLKRAFAAAVFLLEKSTHADPVPEAALQAVFTSLAAAGSAAPALALVRALLRCGRRLPAFSAWGSPLIELTRADTGAFAAFLKYSL
ncbi:hypothetical protein E2562_026325 [Oryza meyeriana var. granulata]|uniref:At1g68980-like TPR repeats domain-containing protein n=1 Tax=Oryza meyeriana var. granulata TaxID=110450 RepID=A0A6G1D8R7_9ORYZ|nr:hypothetical protein E2562_026325 [Oryza meyeriana var. granulata]